jgi:hypothetical protein
MRSHRGGIVCARTLAHLLVRGDAQAGALGYINQNQDAVLFFKKPYIDRPVC